MQQDDDEQWLWHIIFHTLCTSKAKVCDAISEGGRFEKCCINQHCGEAKAQGRGPPKTLQTLVTGQKE